MFFPAELASVRAARRWAADSVRAHGASPDAERLVALLVSELETNAVTYGAATRTIDVDAQYLDGRVRIGVRDDSPEHPVVLDPPPEATGGRGMKLIDTFSSAWGVDPEPGAGKTVWFDLDLDLDLALSGDDVGRAGRAGRAGTARRRATADGGALAAHGPRAGLACVVGAYALSPPDPQDARRLLALLTRLPGVTGFELPLGWVSEVGAEPVLRDLPGGGRHVLTLVRTQAGASLQDPQIGLASTDAAGRRRAVDLVRVAWQEVTALAERGITVDAVEVQSWPSLAPHRAADGAAALTESLSEIAGWPWAGAALVLEHCDARTDARPWQKGLLPLPAEVAAVESVRAVTPRTPVGMAVNWGRSAIEGRDPSLPARHVRELSGRGLLDGVVFSGAPDRDGVYGAAWSDVHPPMHGDQPESLLTPAAVAETIAAGRPSRFLGVKIASRPADAPLERRVELVGHVLDAVHAATT